MVRLALRLLLNRFFGLDEAGASYIEYVLIAGLVAVVCIIAMGLVGDSTALKGTDVAHMVSAS